MGHVDELTALGERLAEEYSALPGVEGFAIGGSVARSFADEASDLEAYVYDDGRLPSVEEIKGIIDRIGAHTTRSSDVHWTHAAWGTHSFFGIGKLRVELGYRSIDATQRRISDYMAGQIAVLEGIHDVPFGWYPSGLAACLAECRIVSDPRGLLKELKKRAQQFPDPLRRALMRYHTEEALEILEHKLIPAHERGDALHFQAALARVVRSCVIAVFTVNGCHYPGDKWNRHYLDGMQDRPPGFLADLENLLAGAVAEPSDRVVALEAVSGWTRWLKTR